MSITPSLEPENPTLSRILGKVCAVMQSRTRRSVRDWRDATQVEASWRLEQRRKQPTRTGEEIQLGGERERLTQENCGPSPGRKGRERKGAFARPTRCTVPNIQAGNAHWSLVWTSTMQKAVAGVGFVRASASSGQHDRAARPGSSE